MIRLAICLSMLLTAAPALAADPFITRGKAVTDAENLFACDGHRYRLSGIGHFTDYEGNRRVVPAPVAFPEAPRAGDLYNPCAGITPAAIADVDLDAVPVVEIDPEGEVITGFLFADNYFELYVNGRLVGVDAVPFTPFNSSVVRFRAKRPVTYAVRLVDWEEHLGLGTERNRGNRYHAGDGGFIAAFSDGTVTDAGWKAQTFYTAPVDSPAHVRAVGTVRDSSAVRTDRMDCREACLAAHWVLPGNWATAEFDDDAWPQASVYTHDTIGVKNKPAFMNFAGLFEDAGAQFIWSSNVVLDNHVIVRKTGDE